MLVTTFTDFNCSYNPALLITEGRGSLKGVVVNKTQETGFNCEFLLAADN